MQSSQRLVNFISCPAFVKLHFIIKLWKLSAAIKKLLFSVKFDGQEGDPTHWTFIAIARRKPFFMVFDYCHEMQFTLLNLFERMTQCSPDFILSWRWSLNIDHSRKRFCFPLFRSSASTEQHNTTHLQINVAHIFSRHLPAAWMRAKFRSSAVIISIFSARRRRDFFFLFTFRQN